MRARVGAQAGAGRRAMYEI